MSCKLIKEIATKKPEKNPDWNPCLPDKTLVGRYYHPSHEATRWERGKKWLPARIITSLREDCRHSLCQYTRSEA